MRKTRAGHPTSQTRKYFFSILFLFSLVSLCLVALSTAYFTNKITSIMTDAFSERHRRSINQLSYLFDNLHAQLIPGLKESSYNNFSYNDLMYSYDLDSYKIMEGLENLDDLLLSYPLIQSIYLYNGQMNFFLTTSSGLEEADSFYDREVLTILNNFNSDFIDYYWPRTACFPESPYFNSILVDKPTLTLLMGTTSSQRAQLKGALIVNLDMDAVTSLLKSEDMNSNDVVFIYNQRGEFITREGDIDKAEMERIYGEIQSRGDDEGVFFEKDRVITYKYNYRLGWFFTGIMPLKSVTTELVKVKRAIILVMFLLITLAFTFSYLSARYIYSPISKLINFMSDGDNKESYLIERKNEISLIQRHYMQVLTEKDTLEDSLQNLNNDYRIEIFHSLLEGNQYHFWLDELEPRDQNLLKGPLNLILFQIDDFYDSCSKMDNGEFRRIRKSITSIIEKGLVEEDEMLIDMTSRNLVCLSFAREDPMKRISALHRRLMDEMPLSLTIGRAFRVKGDKRDLNALYRDAVEKAGGKFLTGYGKIHTEERNTPPSHPIPARVLDKFFSSLMKNDREKCGERLDNILSYLKEVSYSDYLQFINIFCYRFLILLRENGDSPLIPFSSKRAAVRRPWKPW